MPLPIIAGIAIGAVGIEVFHRTVKFFKTSKVERAECALDDAEDVVTEAKKHLAASKTEEAKAPKRAKAKT